MTLDDLVESISGFSSWIFADKIRFFTWYLHTYRQLASVQPRDVAACFDELGLQKPSNIGSFFTSMAQSSPKQALKAAKGYALERRVKAELEEKYGRRSSTVAIHQMLADLPKKINGIEEQSYLGEALICLKHHAFRASIIMTWNLSYDHFIRWILADTGRLAKFNAQLPVTYKKLDISNVSNTDDFSFLKEDQVLTVAKKATLISVSLHKVMKEKLDRRNAVAHPSNIVVSQLTAEECIKDLVENVVLKLV